jgi:hypothetical protein
MVAVATGRVSANFKTETPKPKQKRTYYIYNVIIDLQIPQRLKILLEIQMA